jgi:hypothetical protein
LRLAFKVQHNNSGQITPILPLVEPKPASERHHMRQAASSVISTFHVCLPTTHNQTHLGRPVQTATAGTAWPATWLPHPCVCRTAC